MPSIIGLLLAAGIVWPWTTKGWLLELDWTHGPASRLPADFFFSVLSQPSILFTCLVSVASHVFGIATTAWLAIAVVLVVAANSASRLAPGGLTAKSVAATFYLVNPYVFERLYAGQIGVLAGYAILPLAARSLIHCESRNGSRRWTAAGWMALTGALDVHFVWIGLAFLVALSLWRHRWATLAWAGRLLVLTLVLDAYLVLPHFLQVTPVSAGSGALQAFRTLGDPRWGLYLNVAGLYGFWRIGPVLPKRDVPIWPALVLVFLAVSALGIWRSRRAPGLLNITGPVAVAAVVGYFLSLGPQGPTGLVFELLYRQVPGFAVMREPEKFSALLALGYAVCIGVGVERILLSISSQRARVASSVAAAAMAIAYTPTIFGGLDGQIRVSRYPADLLTAASIVGSGTGRVLALPLDKYISYSYTGRRIIANPAPSLFDRNVLVGGNIGAGPLTSDSLSPEDAYLQSLVDAGPRITELGHLVAQLGVRYVVLEKTADFRSYGWLARQQDLQRVYNGPDITVYRNPFALPNGVRLADAAAVPTVACYIKAAQATDLVGDAAMRVSSVSCPPKGKGSAQIFPDISKSSAIRYEVKVGRGDYVVIPEPADGTWTASGLTPVPLVNGVQGFRAGPGATAIILRRWWAPILGDATSALGSIVLSVIVFSLGRRRDRLAPQTNLDEKRLHDIGSTDAGQRDEI